MKKRIITILLVLITIISLCTVPVLGADDTTQMNFYVTCWSIDTSGNEYIEPLSSTGEYDTWEEVLDSIKNFDVSGYKDYRFGVMVGIDLENAVEVNSGIILPDNTYLLLGNAAITQSVVITGGKNGRMIITEWCDFGVDGLVTNIEGEVIFYVQYEWDGSTQKWIYDFGGNQGNTDPVNPPVNPFPTNPFPPGNTNNADDTTNPTNPDDESNESEEIAETAEDVTVISNPFVDIKESDWFYDDVMYVYAHGLMNGTGDDIFSPTMTLTRGMVVTVLYRLEGSPDVNDLVNPFDDVLESMWYADAVKWAADSGIVNGYGNGKFGPNDNITRQDLAELNTPQKIFHPTFFI